MRAQFTPVSKEHPIEVGVQPVASKRAKHGVEALKNPIILSIVGVGIAVLLVFLGVWIAKSTQPSGNAYTKLPGQAASIAQLTDAEVKALVSKVNTHIMLPSETPQIVAIANVDQLKIDQPFFRSALNGDQLLVYPSRVILYRPSSDQVVDVAQIRAGAEQKASQSSPSSSLR